MNCLKHSCLPNLLPLLFLSLLGSCPVKSGGKAGWPFPAPVAMLTDPLCFLPPQTTAGCLTGCRTTLAVAPGSGMALAAPWR